MLSIEPTGLGAGNKELTAIGVRASICHRKYTGLSMSQLEILVFESCTIDGFATSAIMVGKVTTLAHEIWDHPVEATALVTETLLAGTKSAEVLGCLRDNILPQLKKFKAVADVDSLLIYLFFVYRP